MPSIDDYPETAKEAGTHEAMLERRRLRRAGLLNAPVKNVGGLRGLVERMQGRKPHSLFCKCLECIPMELRPRFAPIPEGMESSEPEAAPETSCEQAPAAPKKANKAKKGFPVPKKKWSEQRGRSSN